MIFTGIINCTVIRRAEMESKMEKRIEEAYWVFDGAKNGYGDHKTAPKTERDAFKMVVSGLLTDQRNDIAKKITEGV